ncbi:MAG: protoglobin family protein [Candidatus Scalindua sp.]|nr:protoglobin family protein [Candidatus Scalindua sp.]
MSIMSDAYMKMYPMEAKKKVTSGKGTAVLDIPEFKKAWELYQETSIDITKRFEYMAQCLNFTDKDTEAIKESKEIIAANLKTILDHIYYEKLIKDPWLSKWFRDEKGNIAKQYVDVRRAKQQKFLLKILECKWDEEFWNHVRWVGAIHVPTFGLEEMYIPVRLNIALWGYLHQYLFNLFAEELKNDPDKLRRITTAWTKFFWIFIDIYHIEYFPSWM